MIYEIYLPSNWNAHILCKRPALLDVNRQIEDEAYPIFIGQNNFHYIVLLGYAIHERFLRWLRNLPRKTAVHYKNIRLYFGDDDLTGDDVGSTMRDLNTLMQTLQGSHLTSAQLCIDCGEEYTSSAIFNPTSSARKVDTD